MFDAASSTTRPPLRHEPPPGSQVSRRQFIFSRLLWARRLPWRGACTTAPRKKIVPYVRAPEELAPGKPLFYATAAILGGYGEGVLVETITGGRPRSSDPDDPASLGAPASSLRHPC